mmetsp:Transcript_24423/g.44820  ORF Transcript_24423/g.44820 Transcript_24423/m.44820 type:complete len:201 (-) Transcript_24423:132-734(-)
MAGRLSRPHRCMASPVSQVFCMLALLCMLASGVRCFTGILGVSSQPSSVIAKATLRDDWDKLAERAKQVAAEKPTGNKGTGGTLRDGWPALAEKAKEVAAAKPTGNVARSASKAPAAPGPGGIFKTRVSGELEERLRREAAFDAEGAPVPGDGPNPYLVIFIVIGALTVATYFELGLDKVGTSGVAQQEMNQRMYAEFRG